MTENKKINEVLKYLKHNKLIVWLIALVTFLSSVVYAPAKDIINGEWGGELVLAIGSQNFSDSSPNYVFFTTPHNLQQEMKFIIPMDFTVVNDSRKKDEDVLLSVRYDKKYLRSIIPDNAITNRSAKINSDFEYELIELSEYDYAKHRLKSLDAKEDFTFVEAAFADKLHYNNEIPKPFENGLAIDVKLTTDSGNTSNRNWDIRYRGVNIDNKNDMEYWVRNYYGKSIALDLRKEYGFFTYLYKLIFGDEIKIFAFYPEFRKVEGKALYVPIKDPKEYNVFIFAPYSWDLLLQ